MIVIPMAGLSRRFREAGYEVPKYMLEAHGYSLFFHSVNSFRNLFGKESFLFVALDQDGVRDFIDSECQKLGIYNYKTVILDTPTRGQAETVYLGLINGDIPADEAVTIFNIDTFRPGFEWPESFDLNEVDGYLETFIGTGANWSNVLPADEKLQSVTLTAEKQEISEYCCTGLYYWRRAKDFLSVFEEYERSQPSEDRPGGELYIAPMYNLIIQRGGDIRYSVINEDQVVFCGVPSEYHEFLEAMAPFESSSDSRQ